VPASTAPQPAQPEQLLPAPPPEPVKLVAPPPAATGSPFAVQLRIDLPVMLGSGAIALGSELAKSELPGPYCGLSCDPGSLNALDRTVVGNNSEVARKVSDVFLGVNIGLPFALDLIDVLVNRSSDGMRGYGLDFLVLAEVLAVNAALNNVVKFAVRRPRPLVYDPTQDEASRREPDAALSFYSGHSSTSFSMATAYSYLFMLRHPGSKLIVPVWILSEGMAAATAYLRVDAGKHFWTDVLTGALVGSALGVLIPYLHHRVMPKTLLTRLAGSGRNALHWLAVPTMSTDGAGLLVTVY